MMWESKKVTNILIQKNTLNIHMALSVYRTIAVVSERIFTFRCYTKENANADVQNYRILIIESLKNGIALEITCAQSIHVCFSEMTSPLGPQSISLYSFQCGQFVYWNWIHFLTLRSMNIFLYCFQFNSFSYCMNLLAAK